MKDIHESEELIKREEQKISKVLRNAADLKPLINAKQIEANEVTVTVSVLVDE